LVPLVVPIYLKQHRREYNQNEPSQRVRGFLFNVIGSAAAALAGCSKVVVSENGVGSINLPISDAQLGSQSTRATHPLALQKIEGFLRSIGVEVGISLPNLFLTKGQMCRQLKDSPFASLAARSISCDGFPPRVVGPEQCGVCTSCLLSRQALWSAFLDDGTSVEPRRYRYDVIRGMDEIPSRDLAPLWDMLIQVDRLERAVLSSSPWQSLSIDFPELREVQEAIGEGRPSAAKAEIQRDLVGLYRNYCAEWREFPAYPEGWSFSSPGLLASA
jgi:hypothetical protein